MAPRTTPGGARASTAVAVRGAAMLVPLLTASCPTDTRMTNQPPPPGGPFRSHPSRGLSPREAADRALRAAVKEAGPAVGEFTPPLPSTWPPNGDRAVVYLAYLRLPMATGVERYEVHAPHLRVDLKVGEAAGAEPTVTRLESSGPLRFPESANVPGPPAELMTRGAQALFDAVRSVPDAGGPDGRGAADLRAAYRAWSGAHQSISGSARAFFPAFFEWIDSDR